VFPRAEEFGFPNEMEAFALQFGHGLVWRCTNVLSSVGCVSVESLRDQGWHGVRAGDLLSATDGRSAPASKRSCSTDPRLRNHHLFPRPSFPSQTPTEHEPRTLMSQLQATAPAIDDAQTAPRG